MGIVPWNPWAKCFSVALFTGNLRWHLPVYETNKKNTLAESIMFICSFFYLTIWCIYTGCPILSLYLFLWLTISANLGWSSLIFGLFLLLLLLCLWYYCIVWPLFIHIYIFRCICFYLPYIFDKYCVLWLKGHNKRFNDWLQCFQLLSLHYCQT